MRQPAVDPARRGELPGAPIARDREPRERSESSPCGRHLVDPAAAGAVLGLDTDLVLREGDLLGRLLDTFVVAQLRAELGVSAAKPRLYHVRQQQGRLEIDLLAELAGGRLVAIEVKADAAPSPDAGRHLAVLRDRYPETFTAGVVLHTGPRAYRLGDRIVAAPISSLWS